MKIGITNDGYMRYGEDRYRFMREDGYRFCDLNLCNTESYIYNCGCEEFEKKLSEEKQLADSAGISFSQVHGPWRYPPKDHTDEDRAERLAKMQTCLKAAAILGAPYMVVHPIMPFGTKEDPDPQLFFDMNVEFYQKLIPFAKKSGVVICIENMPMRALTISPPSNTLALIKALDSKWVQMCLDTGHSIVKGVCPADAVHLAGDYLKVLHIHDNDGTKDQHIFPCAGVIDWKKFVLALKKTDFNGVFSIEAEVDEALEQQEHRKELKRLAQIVNQLAAD